MNYIKFSSIDKIPDPIPESMLFSKQARLLVPKENNHRNDTTTPLELAFCVFELGAGDFAIEKQLLETMNDHGMNTDEFFSDEWGNHVGRAVVRAILDPDRQAPISMIKVYENELGSARFLEPDERLFFENFIDNFGVLEFRN